MQDEALRRAILADPDDDSPRLIYADWLDERGDAERAEFIRVQCALVRHAGADAPRAALLAREEALLAAHRAAWTAPLGRLVLRCEFRRGFVEEAECDGTTFVRRADDLFGQAPVRALRLLSLPAVRVPELVQCPHLGRLARLDLSYNALGDMAVLHLTRCPHFAGLLALDLAYNNVGSAGARWLISCPYFTSLEYLNLGGNGRLARGEPRAALQRRFGKRVAF